MWLVLATLTRCVAWRQTKECRASGPRELQQDKPCRAVIPPSSSGWCECELGERVQLNCGHSATHCDAACRMQKTTREARRKAVSKAPGALGLPWPDRRPASRSSPLGRGGRGRRRRPKRAGGSRAKKSAGRSAPSITSLAQLKAAGGYREWAPPPRLRATPGVCVVSVVTFLMAPASWAPKAAELNLNYCLTHGYTFGLVTLRLAPEEVRVHWDKPRAALMVAEHHGETRCAYVLHLDADAVVHGATRSLVDVVAPYLVGSPSPGLELWLDRPGPDGRAPSDHPPPSLLFTSHTPLTRAAAATGCNCSHAVGGLHGGRNACASAARLLVELHHRPCFVNTGVFVLRNTDDARMMLRRWAYADFGDLLQPSQQRRGRHGAGAGGAGGGDANDTVGDIHPEAARRIRRRCQLRSPERSSEQTCANALKLLWPRRVAIVPSSVLNYMNAHLPDGGPSCLHRNDTYVCHLMGESSARRTQALRAELSARRASLAAMVAARNDTATSYTVLTESAPPSQRWR